MGKKIISYFLILPTIAILVVSVVGTIISKTILDENFVKMILTKNNYYQQVYQDMQENFKNNTIQTGLKEDVLFGIISEESVKKDINNIVSYIYGSKDSIEIETKNLQENLKENIQKQIQENKKNVTNDEQEAIDIYVETIINIYKSGITYSSSSLKDIKEALTKIIKLLNTIKIGSYISICILFLFIIVINKKQSFSYLSITMNGCGIICIFLTVAKKIFINIDNILIFNKAFSLCAIASIKAIFLTIFIVGIIFIVLGIILSILESKVSRRKE